MTNKPAVFITGAGRNIGALMARQFLQSGLPVIAHYRTPTDEIASLQQLGAHIIQGDFNSPASTSAIAEQVVTAASGLRAIIHNASAFGPTATQLEDASAQFQRFYEVHMLAPFLLNRLLEEHLAGSVETPADIIHITDIYADNPAVEYDAYCATKAGSQNLALSAAKRLAPTVKVNVIQPGPISFQDWHDAKQRQQVLQSTPLAQAAGGPIAIYRAVRAAMDNPFQTGAVIAVDGGRHLLR